jgi:hypothetical protein
MSPSPQLSHECGGIFAAVVELSPHHLPVTAITASLTRRRLSLRLSRGRRCDGGNARQRRTTNDEGNNPTHEFLHSRYMRRLHAAGTFGLSLPRARN